MAAPTGTIATIVIPTHDRPQLAQRAIASALRQTLADLEVVVVDDGSSPPFVPASTDPRVRLVRHETPPAAVSYTHLTLPTNREV